MLTPAASALAVAHQHHVAHLDVKPANLFIATDEGETTVKVLDFGIAKAFTSRTITRAFTRDGGSEVTAFTPDYAAPEQFNKMHGVTGPHTDVFALALVLIELASGKKALDGDTPLQLYVAAANDRVRPSLAAHGVDAPPEIESALRTALAVDPRERFPDVGAMWRAMQHGGNAPALAISPLSKPGGRVFAVIARTGIARTGIPRTGIPRTGIPRCGSLQSGFVAHGSRRRDPTESRVHDPAGGADRDRAAGRANGTRTAQDVARPVFCRDRRLRARGAGPKCKSSSATACSRCSGCTRARPTPPNALCMLRSARDVHSTIIASACVVASTRAAFSSAPA